MTQVGLVWRLKWTKINVLAQNYISVKAEDIGPSVVVKPKYQRKRVSWRLAPKLSDGYH